MFWIEYWAVVLAAILATPLVASVAFALWLGRQGNITLETGAKCWETFIKLVSAFTIIVSGAMLFGKYIDQQSGIQITLANQAQREIGLREAEVLRHKLVFDIERHDQKRQLLREAKKRAARIASAGGADAPSRVRFEELYFADLIGVEQDDGPVEEAMVRFREKMKGLAGAPDLSLYKLSLELSIAVEEEISVSEVKLRKLQERISALIGPKVPEK